MVTPAQSQMIDALMAPGQYASQISAAIAKKSQDADEQQGAEVLQLLDGSTQAGDPLVAKATGMGGLLDITG